ncbi:tRNA (cytosine(32)/uridine(32)-2'-O)-methyltransferase TrmJ [Thiocapsa imhoffii]|uniref:tRNA (cytidine/uridine-2'-O-)-methyltransferase TrmJ n=1 Tax=Thiocapsa imhoffii TaxID=382777 RepID=A0A9X0WFM1_9GAMM|nr:RNA methyltransferase [Thiocapsa imhoffii]MBK1643816.1 tRNA (cytosine(32)/uridine(32)-2'-O)-methyltransferase TrmJ [Thiocapsa imhoffii]
MTEPLTTTLTRIRFVLVEPSLSGNIGATARAMKTMGLSRLELVTPKQALDADALARACGADDVLQHAGIHPDLPSALAGCRLVIGTSARRRTLEWPTLDPAECARELIREAAAGEVALLFGRESSGLTNNELARCHQLVHIPTNPEFSSLNLAAAVQVFAYEIRRCVLSTRPVEPNPGTRDLATADELEGLFQHLAETLVTIGYGDPEHSRKLMLRLRQLFNRARPDRVELNILRGILSAAQGRKRARQSAPNAADGTPPSALSPPET